MRTLQKSILAARYVQANESLIQARDDWWTRKIEYEKLVAVHEYFESVRDELRLIGGIEMSNRLVRIPENHASTL